MMTTTHKERTAMNGRESYQAKADAFLKQIGRKRNRRDTNRDDEKQPDKPKRPRTRQEMLAALVERANNGDKAALKKLREVLDSQPEIWQSIGDVAQHARLTLMRLIAGEDRLMLESLQRQTAQMENDLLGSSNTPLEELCIQRIIACWLQLQYADTMCVSATSENITQAKFWSDCQQRADRRFNAAIKSLSAVRKFLPSANEPKAVPERNDTTSVGPSEAPTTGEPQVAAAEAAERPETKSPGHNGTATHTPLKERIAGSLPADANGQTVANTASDDGAETHTGDEEDCSLPEPTNGKSVNRILQFTNPLIVKKATG